MLLLVIMSNITVFGLTEQSGSCGCSYIVYHYYFRFYGGFVHVVVILSTITVYGLTVDWVMLLLYCLPLLCMA